MRCVKTVFLVLSLFCLVACTNETYSETSNEYLIDNSLDIVSQISSLLETYTSTDSLETIVETDTEKVEPTVIGEPSETEQHTVEEKSITVYVPWFLVRSFDSEVYARTTDDLNVREEPSTDSTKIKTLRKNTDIVLTGEFENWYQIDKSYFVHKDYVQLAQSIPGTDLYYYVDFYNNRVSGLVTATALNVRVHPHTTSEIVYKLYMKSRVEIVGEVTVENMKWYYVFYNDEYYFISAEYVLFGEEAEEFLENLRRQSLEYNLEIDCQGMHIDNPQYVYYLDVDYDTSKWMSKYTPRTPENIELLAMAVRVEAAGYGIWAQQVWTCSAILNQCDRNSCSLQKLIDSGSYISSSAVKNRTAKPIQIQYDAINHVLDGYRIANVTHWKSGSYHDTNKYVPVGYVERYYVGGRWVGGNWYSLINSSALNKINKRK